MIKAICINTIYFKRRCLHAYLSKNRYREIQIE